MASDYQFWAEELVLSGNENPDAHHLAFSNNLELEEADRRFLKVMTATGTHVPLSEMEILEAEERRLIGKYKIGEITGEELISLAAPLFTDSEWNVRFQIWYNMEDDISSIRHNESFMWYKWSPKDIEGSIRDILQREKLI